MKKTYLLLTCMALMFTYSARAQDTLYTPSEKIICKVLKISEKEIEYKKWSNPDGPVYTATPNSVSKIVFHNGETEHFGRSRLHSRMYRNCVKVDLFAPAFHKTTIGYEYVLNRHVHFEGYFSFISSRIFSRHNNTRYTKDPLTSGIGTRLCAKIPLTSDARANAHHTQSNLGGWFIRLDLLYTRVAVSNVFYRDYDRWYGGTVGTVNVDQYGMVFNLGWQTLVGNSLTIQMNAGFGYLADNTIFKPHTFPSNGNYRTYYENTSFRSGNAIKTGNTVICGSGNLTLGYILGKKNSR